MYFFLPGLVWPFFVWGGGGGQKTQKPAYVIYGCSLRLALIVASYIDLLSNGNFNWGIPKSWVTSEGNIRGESYKCIRIAVKASVIAVQFRHSRQTAWLKIRLKNWLWEWNSVRDHLYIKYLRFSDLPGALLDAHIGGHTFITLALFCLFLTKYISTCSESWPAK